MKRVFKVILRPGNGRATYKYEVIAANAKGAIDKAMTQLEKDISWAGSVIVEKVLHRGRII